MDCGLWVLRIINSRKMMWAGQVACMCQIEMHKRLGKRLIGDLCMDWSDIEMDIKETWWEVWSGFV
jgi:hypothetical protein